MKSESNKIMVFLSRNFLFLNKVKAENFPMPLFKSLENKVLNLIQNFT